MKKKVSPFIIIPLSFFTIIVIGTILLALPISTKDKGLDIADAFFISTSSVTITGLSTISNLANTLSLFGKIVLLLLIQIGGLSVITISVFFMSVIGVKIGIDNRLLVKETLNQKSLSGIVRLVKKTIKYTFIVEGIGFVINMIVFRNLPFGDNFLISLFHSVSAFNNAGLDLLGDTSLQLYSNNVLLNVNTSLLIIFGGIGFIVVDDIMDKKSLRKLSIHSKIVLKMNILLWIFGVLTIKISEGNSVTFMQSVFMSVSSRTAGFSSIDMSVLKTITLLIISFLMFVGASPASSGGGIKVTTLYTLIKSIMSYITGRKTITSNRYISEETKYKAFILFSASSIIVATGIVLLTIFDNLELAASLIEVVSAFSNTGLSVGVTPTLSIASKVILALIMFIGRSGVLTTLMMFNKDWYKKKRNVEYIEEKLLIG
ncbi:TrkH family potassium uptake protein [Haploplasma axanthum]|uniref:TrkH family potassium uptake protein n=1 Tax=Haploplasma axanthum TaxID=29552 RepID=UPI00042247BA|nr:potassium transporter TrkG [Haploplasma axanthum]